MAGTMMVTPKGGELWACQECFKVFASQIAAGLCCDSLKITESDEQVSRSSA